jgi:hypothetical protein
MKAACALPLNEVEASELQHFTYGHYGGPNI